MQTSLIIIDDFYDDPFAIRDAALALRFKKQRYADGKFSYQTAKVPEAIRSQAIDKIITIIGKEFRGQFIKSNFHLENRNETKSRPKTYIHIDKLRWIGIIYLNPPFQCTGGTNFYQHKGTGHLHWNDVIRDHKAGIQSHVQIRKDARKIQPWLLTDTVAMRFNRLLLYDGRYFHQPASHFGMSKGNSRLIQTISFGETFDNA